MTTPQIILYAIVGLLLVFFIRRKLQAAAIKQYSATDIPALLKRSDVVLLDVRTDAERSRQHIKGSLHLPLHRMNSDVNILSSHNEKEIICYCQSGSRSNSAAAKLQKKGFNAANLKGGMAAWNYSNRA